MGRPLAPRQYDLQSLLDAAHIGPDDDVCETLHISGRTFKRMRDEGLTERQADRLACKLGLPTGFVWPEWFRETPTDVLFARYALARTQFERARVSA